jgi:hypothetical protein
MKHAARLLFALSLFLPSLGCDKATPVAPTGTTLTISASPTKIGLSGSSTITVVGRKPDGNPLNPGTEVRLSTDRGTVSPSVVQVDSSGRATSTFRGDGRSGAAKVTASTADATAEISIQVGESAETKPSLIVSISPNTVRVGESATVTIIARNADGSTVGAGEEIIVTSNLGTFTNSRPKTKADGTATTTLNAGNQAGTATIKAVLRSSDAAEASLTIRDFAADLILTPTEGTINSTGGSITFTVNVTNTQGEPFQGAVVTFSTNVSATFEGGTNVVLTDTSGAARKQITFSQENLKGVTEVRVTASTPRSTGTPITKTAIFRVV